MCDGKSSEERVPARRAILTVAQPPRAPSIDLSPLDSHHSTGVRRYRAPMSNPDRQVASSPNDFLLPALRVCLLVVAMFATGLGCASLGQRLEPPEVSLVNVQPLATTGFEQRFEVTVRLTNPNDRPLTGEGIDVTLALNGKRLGRAVSADSFEIPRLGDDVVTLVATTNFLDLFRQALALPDAGGQLDYALDGRVLLSGSVGWLPFSHAGSLVPESLAR